MAGEGRKQRAKALGEPGLGLDQQPFGLVDAEEQARRTRRLEFLRRLARERGPFERVAQRRDGRVRIARQLLGEQFGGAKRPSRQLRPERLGGEQAFGEGKERVGAGDRQRPAPQVDFGKDAGQDEARREAGAQQRRFARAAGADDEQEGRATRLVGRRLEFAQAADRLVDDAAAAKEHVLAGLVEGRQAGERRAEARAVPHRALGDEAAPRQPLAQAVLDLAGEFVGGGEFLERGEEFAGAGAEPLFEKIGQPAPLRFDFGAVARIQGDERRVRPAKDVDIRYAVALAPRLDRAQDFVSGSAGVGLARRHGRKLRRQRRAEPGAEDRDDQIAGRRLGNLGLEGFVRGVVARLPADGADARAAGELGVEPLDDEIDPLALGLHVAGRGDEKIEDRLARHRPRLSVRVARTIAAAGAGRKERACAIVSQLEFRRNVEKLANGPAARFSNSLVEWRSAPVVAFR